MPRAPTKSIAALATCVALGAWTAHGPAAPTRASLYHALAGEWNGSLDYKDYSNPDRRVTLPTKLRVQFSTDSAALLMHYTYDDGPGKIVESDDRFSVDAKLTRVTWGSVRDTNPQQFVARASMVAQPAGTEQFIFEGEGRDDNKPATIRETFTISAKSLRILKETRFAGTDFAFRHTYVLARR